MLAVSPKTKKVIIMDSYLTTLYFAYFKARRNIEELNHMAGLPKAEGEPDFIKVQLNAALEHGKEIESLLTEYTLILKGGKK